MIEIDKLSVFSLAEKIRHRQLSCVEVAMKFLENVEKHKELNAMIYVDKARALREAAQLDHELSQKGPDGVGRLHGVPIVVKDNVHVKGMANTAGCPGLSRLVPKEDAVTVKALRDVIFTGFFMFIF